MYQFPSFAAKSAVGFRSRSKSHRRATPVTCVIGRYQCQLKRDFDFCGRLHNGTRWNVNLHYTVIAISVYACT